MDVVQYKDIWMEIIENSVKTSSIEHSIIEMKKVLTNLFHFNLKY